MNDHGLVILHDVCEYTPVHDKGKWLEWVRIGCP